MRNDCLRTLDDGQPVLGAWVTSNSPRAAEVLAGTGLDWVGIDTEHAPVAGERLESLVRAVESGGATPIVRLRSVEHAASGGCKRALDSGAQGVIVPRVESAADAERAVGAARFPPEGDRGVAGTVRANRYGDDFDAYVERATDGTLVALQIETATAVEAVDEILAVPGVDVAFVGENDLSATYGVPGETTDDLVADAVEHVRRAADDVGVHLGAAARTPDAVDRRAERGFAFLLLGSDLGLLRAGLDPYLG